MSCFRSIRFQQTLWHGLLLAVVLAGLGFTAWNARKASDLRAIDQQLDQRIAVVIRGTRPVPFGRPPIEALGWADSLRNQRPLQSRLGENLPSLDLFDYKTGYSYYAIVWLPDGGERSRSGTAPADLQRPLRLRGLREERTRGTFREVIHFTPLGECMLVGRDIKEDLMALRQYGWFLFGACGLVLLVELAGGWWISSRTLRPIKDISEAAARIATGDLSRRIETRTTGSELDQLADVLNDTFTRLEAAFTRQTQFTADAAHELRTPITVMLTHVQNGLSSECPNTEHREAFEACERASQRMRRLTESLLRLARIDSGDAGADRGPCDLKRVVAETLSLLLPLAESQGIRLDSDLEPAWCHGNLEQLGQVATNLVCNAINYNRPGGSVQVSLRKLDGFCVLVVDDSGQGISAIDLPHIFERFYRVDKARSSTAGRMGLGLAICKAIVEAHSGNLRASSTLGQGSRFTVRLPYLQGHP